MRMTYKHDLHLEMSVEDLGYMARTEGYAVVSWWRMALRDDLSTLD